MNVSQVGQGAEPLWMFGAKTPEASDKADKSRPIIM